MYIFRTLIIIFVLKFFIAHQGLTMASDSRSNERIDFRINSDSKALFARAAKLSGTTLSSFVIEAARERAIRIIHEHERLLLNNEDRDILMDALANLPAQNAALRAAAKKYAVKK